MACSDFLCWRGKLYLPLRVVKYVIMAINLCFFVLGFILIGTGAYAYSYGELGAFVTIPSLALGIIIIGAVMVSLSFLGCCSSYVQSRLLLTVFFVMIIVVLIAQISCAIAATAFSGQVEGWVRDGYSSIDNKTKDYLLKEFHCCGFQSPSDDMAFCGNQTEASNYPGCYDVLTDFIKGKLKALEVAAGVLGFLEVICLILSCVLCTRMPSRNDARWEERKLLWNKRMEGTSNDFDSNSNSIRDNNL